MTTRLGTIDRQTALVGTYALGDDDTIKQALERAQDSAPAPVVEMTGQQGQIIHGTLSSTSSWQWGVLWRSRWGEQGAGSGFTRYRAPGQV